MFIWLQGYLFNLRSSSIEPPKNYKQIYKEQELMFP